MRARHDRKAPVPRRSTRGRRRRSAASICTFLAIEIRRLLRNRRTVVVTLVVPVVLFLLLKSDRRGLALGGTELTAATTMIGIAVYGAMLAATSGGAMVSIERALGWSRQLRLTPLRPARLHRDQGPDRDAAGPHVGRRSSTSSARSTASRCRPSPGS